ncbi:HTH-type transcriptional regulator ImmR [compost metagenome]
MFPVYAKRLKEARLKANNMTQMQVRDATGINNKTLSGYETGKNEPDFETLRELCELYGVTTDWILGKTNNPHGTLTDAEKGLAKAAIDMDEESFLEGSIKFKGRELTQEEKQKLQEMARLFLS